MSAIQIQGLRPLKGTVGIQGSKNAVLPMMAASLLADGVTVIRHVPEIEDVFSMMGILESHRPATGSPRNTLGKCARPVSFLDRFWRNGERR